MKAKLLMLIAVSLSTACSSPAISVMNNGCDGFSLIKASRQDTTETLRQIKVHNDTYRAICTEAKHGH